MEGTAGVEAVSLPALPLFDYGQQRALYLREEIILKEDDLNPVSSLGLCVYLLKTRLRPANDREGGAWKGSTNDNRFLVMSSRLWLGQRMNYMTSWIS